MERTPLGPIIIANRMLPDVPRSVFEPDAQHGKWATAYPALDSALITCPSLELKTRQTPFRGQSNGLAKKLRVMNSSRECASDRTLCSVNFLGLTLHS